MRKTMYLKMCQYSGYCNYIPGNSKSWGRYYWKTLQYSKQNNFARKTWLDKISFFFAIGRFRHFRLSGTAESVMCYVIKIHLKRKAKWRRKPTKKRRIIDVFLLRHTWHFPALQKFSKNLCPHPPTLNKKAPRF